jgi:hypothetical protein
LTTSEEGLGKINPYKEEPAKIFKIIRDFLKK